VIASDRCRDSVSDGSIKWVLKRFGQGFILTFVLICVAACGSGATSSGSHSADGNDHSIKDYEYLHQHNAILLDGKTVRWPLTTVTVSGATSSAWRTAIARWSAINFIFVDTGGEINLRYDHSDDWCGRADRSFSSTGVIYDCTVRISTNHERNGCGVEADTVTHEIGHCIGFYGETHDGGVMDLTTAGSSEITTAVRQMISLLYALPAGYDVTSRLTN